MSERFVARVSPWRTGLLIAGSLGFVALSIWLVRRPSDGSGFSFFFGWVGILLFGGFGLVGARQLFRTGPVLEIDGKGILWRRWSDQVIPWNAISGLSILQVQRQRSLTINLVDPARFPGHGLMGLLARANRSMSGGDISLNVAGTDRQFDEMLDAIQRFSRRKFS